MILLRALVGVIHAILQAAAAALVAGFSLLFMVLVVLVVLGALIAALAGGLGLGGARLVWRRRRAGEADPPADDPSKKP